MTITTTNQPLNVEIQGTPVIWGVRLEYSVMPIIAGLGQVILKRRFRPKSVGTAFVREADGSLAKYYLKHGSNRGEMELGPLVALNKKEMT